MGSILDVLHTLSPRVTMKDTSHPDNKSHIASDK
jgi:hypothetical protein